LSSAATVSSGPLSPSARQSPEGGWGIKGHTNTGADIAAAARAELTAIAAKKSA